MMVYDCEATMFAAPDLIDWIMGVCLGGVTVLMILAGLWIGVSMFKEGYTEDRVMGLGLMIITVLTSIPLLTLVLWAMFHDCVLGGGPG